MGRAEARRAQQRGGARGAARGGSSTRRTGIRRLFTWKKIVGTLFGLCLLGMGAFVVLYLVIDVPQGNAAAKLQSNVYKYSDGSVMARTGQVNREIVDLAEIPKDVQHTFVAAENKTFYEDKGIDLKGTARGVLNTLSGKGTQGGSTITQQYVKNYYLSQDQTISRKLKEIVISLKVDRQKSKDDILAGYINTSYYGRGAWGIQAAAQAYYGIDAGKLNVQQGAYLAALLQAPSQYDWAVASDTGKKLVKERWNYVLNNMVGKHWLDKSKRDGLTFPVPHKPKADRGLQGQTGYLVRAADASLEKQLVAQGSSQKDAETMVHDGGWTMTLNIDKSKQRQLEKAVTARLTNKLDPKARKDDANVQAGAVSVDPKTGGIVAMYGGEGVTQHYFNNATRSDYQPASTFKPIILASALENQAQTQNGRPINADTVYDGTSKRPVMDHGSKVGFAPPNEDDVNYGPSTVQKAMNKSINSVFAQMGVDVGMDQVMKTAGELGMDVKNQPAVPAQTLGSMGASPMEMAGVYATLDNHGKKVTPQILKSAEHKDATVQMPDPIGSQVISRGAADSVTSVLTGVVDDGTGFAVRNSAQAVAGKTGTSDEDKSAWFTGYTPNLVTSVGLFGEAAQGAKDAAGKPVATGTHVTLSGAGGGGRVNGGGFPAEIWAAYTFDAMGAPSQFDLQADTGAAVETPSTPQDTPSTPQDTPSTQPPSTPQSTPPTSPSAPESTPPSTPPTDTPSGGVTPPTDPATPTFGFPQGPGGTASKQPGQGNSHQ
ncbi:transglycosylase domain-containing protein [Streptomyces sp. NPDC046821]|uniref:transglycosylase domain-containing protein n=1 Tax=Streptomyces sp. NPDC046821 TaxID=3154702 RepID=UPI0033E138ED